MPNLGRNGISMLGWTPFAVQLRNAAGRFDKMGKTTAAVGTAVQYATFVDEGTSRMIARPFFEPGLRRVKAEGWGDEVWEGAFAEGSGRRIASSDEAAEGAALKVAEAAASSIKDVIDDKDIWDTGALHDSIEFGRDEAEMKLRSVKAAEARRPGSTSVA
jgi:hypothetical protein